MDNFFFGILALLLVQKDGLYALLSSVATHSDLCSDTQSDFTPKVSGIIPDSLSG
ncbi:MAG: hypothetical protein HN700_06135 [Verrucomicrobia bacterium]|jgi:hypothetical protein|nr:hypothetical protein [Verrucomicrobiota bacterium]